MNCGVICRRHAGGRVAPFPAASLAVFLLMLTPPDRLRFAVAALLLSGSLAITNAEFSSAEGLTSLVLATPLSPATVLGFLALHRHRLLLHLLICLSLGQLLTILILAAALMDSPTLASPVGASADAWFVEVEAKTASSAAIRASSNRKATKTRQ